jgi:flagellar biosynthesis GTPase FlhF
MKMVSLLTYIVLVVLCAAIGILMGIYNIHFNFYLVIPLAFVLAFGLLFARNTYIFSRSTNMIEVERLLNKYRKRHYFGFLIESLNANYSEAEKHLAHVKNEQQKAIGMTSLYIHRKDSETAKRENYKIKNDEIRYYNSALIALLEGDMEQFHIMKDKVNRQSTKLVLDTEEAYKKGQLEEAERLGNMSISLATGLQKLSLIKSLEREQKNPNRESYF